MNTFMSAEEALNISKKNGYSNAEDTLFDEIESSIKRCAEAGNVCTEFNVELNTTNMQLGYTYITAIRRKLENLGYTIKIGAALVGDTTKIPITISWFKEKE